MVINPDTVANDLRDMLKKISTTMKHAQMVNDAFATEGLPLPFSQEQIETLRQVDITLTVADLVWFQ